MKYKLELRLWSMVLTVAIVFGLVYVQLFTSKSDAVEIDSTPNDFTIGSTVIGFSGYEWWVIGDGEVRASDTPISTNSGNTVTLWSKYYNFSTCNFYTSSTYGYANQYISSTLRVTMEGLISKKLFTETREKEMVIKRTIAGENTINLDGRTYTTEPVDSKVWPLSKDEWNTINNNNVRYYGSYYWLRSPHPTIYNKVYVGATNGASIGNEYPVNHNYAIRPAFNLTLPNILFTSVASGTEVKSTTMGSMTSVKTTTDTIKLTAEDNTNLSQIILTDPSLSTNGLTASPGSTVSFEYSGATTGRNKYVSALIYDEATQKVMAHGVVGTADSGTATFTMPDKSDLPIGDYKLWVYNEEISGDNYTDYASTPTKVDLRVRDVTIDLTASPYTKVYNTDTNNTVDISAEVNNYISGKSTIEDTQWFRVQISDVTDYSNNFDKKYASALDTNKGVIADPGISETKETFTLTVDKNATYWFKGTAKERGATSTAVSSITIDNIYEVIEVRVRGEDSSGSQLYDYEPISGKYGIPYDLDRNVLSSTPSNGFDTVTLEAKSPYNNSSYWSFVLKSSNTTIDATGYTLTLDSNFPFNAHCDSRNETKYTILYSRTNLWRTITANFVDNAGTPIADLKGMNFETFEAPQDSNGNVVDFLSGGGSYIPPTITGYSVTGYKVGNMLEALVPLTDFSTFAPYIPAGTNDVYMVYEADPTITVDYYYRDNNLIQSGVSVDYAKSGSTYTFDTSTDGLADYQALYYKLSSDGYNTEYTIPPNSNITIDVSGDETIAVYCASTTINVTFPTLEFHANSNTRNTVKNGDGSSKSVDYYEVKNNSDYPVQVVFTKMAVVNNDGVDFVSSFTDGNNDEVILNLGVYNGSTPTTYTNGFDTTASVSGIVPENTYSTVLGTLDGVFVQQDEMANPHHSQYGYVNLSGQYQGSSTTRSPQITLRFTYTLVK